MPSRGAGALMLTSNTAYAGRYVATPILLVWGAVVVEAIGTADLDPFPRAEHRDRHVLCVPDPGLGDRLPHAQSPF